MKQRLVSGFLNLLIILVSLSVPLLVLEVALRQFPTLIHKPVLVEFRKELRREIAARLKLPLKQARRCIAAADRLDRGPELCLAYPDFNWVQEVDDVDRLHGAQESILQDGNGFCNAGHKADRDRNEVLFVGDSFTWCTAVQPDSTFAAVLENGLEKPTYNLGFPGIGLYEYIEILRRFGLDYRPDIVVLSVYEGNDLRDGIGYWKAKKESAEDEVAVSNVSQRPQKTGIKRLVERSYSLNYVAGSVEAVLKRLKRGDINFRYQVRVGNEQVPMNVTNADRDEVKHARRLLQGEANTSVWQQALEHFSELGQTQGFSPVVVYIPSAYTAYASSVLFEDEKAGDAVKAQSLLQRKYLATQADRLGLAFIDITADLQKAVESGPLAYFPGNVHLTAHGHGLIARILEPQLRALADRGSETGRDLE